MKKILFILLFLLFAQSSFATDYYVDCNAAAGGDGSLATPWDAVADVNGASFSGDDNIYFARGCTWRENLIIPSSGTSGHPITFGAYGTGDRPYLKPTADIGANWVTYSGSGDSEVWTFDCMETLEALWLADDWVPYVGTGVNPAAGEWKRDTVDNSIIYYNPIGSANPNTLNLSRSLYLTDHDYGINITSKHDIVVQDLQVSHSGTVNFYFWAAYNITVKRSHSTKCGNPIQVYPNMCGDGFSFQSNCHDITIEDCESDNAMDSGFTVEILYGNPQDIKFIRDSAHDNGYYYDATRKCLQCNGFFLYGTNFTVDSCEAYSNDHEGLVLGGNGSGHIVKNNDINSNGNAGVWIRNGTTGANITYNNIYDNNKANNTGYSSSALEIGATSAGTVSGINIYNNLMGYTTGSIGSGLYVRDNCTLSNTNIKNNIFFGNSYADLKVWNAFGANVVFDNNSYSSINGSSGHIIRFESNIQPPRRYTVAQFTNYQTTESQDANSFTADPLFTNASGGDFRLLGNSPAIDKGIDVGLILDYKGTKVPRGSAPDMGALEYWPKIYFPPSKLYTNPIDIRRLSFEPY